ncbi:hypothetical protein GUJ93_ZPchr0574g9 [Zizania palustris]|uniref:Uncharacterized protein n=1 Tax=Zizania palustris TaxID=103762 RepID=A0A8J5T7M7_ZIZPA|nr:hypothetical protein GUJ93_ZPchr0574g9 [Zizania palustris]
MSGSLQSLSFYRCSDEGLENLSKGCHALKSLNLGYSVAISDRGIASVFRNCPNIGTINISYCRGLSGVGFRGYTSSLSYLEAESCMLSPDGLLDVVSGGGLEYLNLHGFRRSTELISWVELVYAEKLRFLNLRIVRSLTDDSVIAIASGCPLIEEWNLAGVPWS